MQKRKKFTKMKTGGVYDRTYFDFCIYCLNSPDGLLYHYAQDFPENEQTQSAVAFHRPYNFIADNFRSELTDGSRSGEFAPGTLAGKQKRE